MPTPQEASLSYLPTRWFVTGGSGFVGRALLRRLATDGHEAFALARSDQAVDTVGALGAHPVRGDLGDLARGDATCDGADVVVHLAAETDLSHPPAAFRHANVEGTRSVVNACGRAHISRLVHISTEAVLADGAPLKSVDESRPLTTRPAGIYSASKAEAERIVAAAPRALQTVVLRPRFVWGPDDSTMLPQLIEAVRSGRFAWPGGGEHLTSTTYVENLVDAILLAGSHEAARGVYFVADDDTTTFRSFITDLLATHGVTPPDRNIPLGLARALAFGGESAWWVLRRAGKPPLTRQELALMFVEVTVNDSRIRHELGYRPRFSRDDGLAALARATPRQTVPATDPMAQAPNPV